MLSAETAAGKYPVEAIKMMAKIVMETEAQEPLGPQRRTIDGRACTAVGGRDHLRIHGARRRGSGHQRHRGSSPRRVRPPGSSPSTGPSRLSRLSSAQRVINRMVLLWGVQPILCNKLATAEQMVETAERLLEAGGHVQARQILGIVAGTRTKSGSTNFLRLHVLGDSLTEATSAHEKTVARQRVKSASKSKTPPQALPRRARSGR